jgi:hypothetical protein
MIWHVSKEKCSFLLDDTSSANPTIKPRWYGSDEEASYAIVWHSPFYVRAAAVGATCSDSGVAVPVSPTDASDGGIRAAKNYVAGENWTQDFDSDTMLDDTSFANPIIKPRWYGRDEGGSYSPTLLTSCNKSYQSYPWSTQTFGT